ncbi:MAG: CHAT domain-containing protein, partial [Bacteroidales bacterium]|nr:CHAT domain-containing protein [Bacteroidales bacterium]
KQSLYIFAITADTAISRIQALPADFQESLSQFRNHLVQSDFSSFTSENFNNYKNLGYDLYELMIKPVDDVLSGKRLIIIPDHQLGYLPFEVLITEQTLPGPVDFSGLPYLMLDHPISYTYSATLLFTHFHRRNIKPYRILAFAPDYFTQDKRKVSDSQRAELLPIPWAKTEAKNISSTYLAKSYLGDKATEISFKSKAPGFKVLHLAMHTLIDNENPLYSKLVFSPPTDSLEDGFLNTYELFNLELNADLAVLSACKTGDGRLSRGEGIMSLARGFFYAGVPSIVMTLWSVDDKASSELVILFYQYLSKGYKKDKALQMAKLAFLSSSDKLKSHPHFWAGFVNIGETAPVTIYKVRSSILVIFIGILLFGVAIVLVARKKKSIR